VSQDPRRRASCEHDALSLLRQRVYALASGYEHLNEYTGLRRDLAIQTAVGRDQELACAPTLCRWENRADRQPAWQLHVAWWSSSSFPSRARLQLILDFDARRHDARQVSAFEIEGFVAISA